jgi:DNA repair protein RecO (recombination protein O)
MSTLLRDRLYSTEAIVLSRRDLGEADRILTLFTPNHGKLSVIAKGSRKAKSRSGPHLDVLSRSNIDLAKGRDLDVVTSAQYIDIHERLRTDLDAFCAASYLAELVRHLTQEHQEQPPVYDLLKRSLAVINEGVEPWLVMRYFEFGLLSLLGYRPELYQCVSCSQPIEARVNAWSPSLGGIICTDCVGIDPGAKSISINAQKYLRTMERSGLGSIAKLELSAGERGEVERALGDYVRYIAERDFGSLRVMSSLREMASAKP